MGPKPQYSRRSGVSAREPSVLLAPHPAIHPSSMRSLTRRLSSNSAQAFVLALMRRTHNNDAKRDCCLEQLVDLRPMDCFGDLGSNERQFSAPLDGEVGCVGRLIWMPPVQLLDRCAQQCAARGVHWTLATGEQCGPSGQAAPRVTGGRQLRSFRSRSNATFDRLNRWSQPAQPPHSGRFEHAKAGACFFVACLGLPACQSKTRL